MRDVAPLLWTQIWQATGAIVAVGVLTRVFWSRRPHVSYLLWMVVLVKCLTPPVLNASFGAFGWIETRRALTPTESRSSPMVVADANDPEPPTDARTPVPVEIAPADASADEAPPDTSSQTTERFPRIPLLLAVWGVGALGLGGVIVRKWLLLRRVVKRSRAPIDPDLASLAKEVADQLGLRSKIRLVITDEPIGPAVFGVLRPTVLLPEALIRSLSPAELRALLAHELTHVRRRDGWAAALQVVVQTVWWFHPLVWWANRQACRERERCCDREVVARLRCTPASYANVLLKVLETRRSLLPEFGSLGIRPADVTARRLEDIMKRTSGSRRRTPVWRWAVALLIAALLLPGQRTPSSAASDESDDGLTARVKAPKARDADKTLRYDGKDFAWWRNELRTELKADLRIEALKAMGAFGANGHGREATVAIIDAASGYYIRSRSNDDQRVVDAAWMALKKIGPAAAAPLIAAAKDENRSRRRFAVGRLNQFDRNEDVANALVLASKDADPQIRRGAIWALSTQGSLGVAALADMLQHDDLETRTAAAQVLSDMGPTAVVAAPALIGAARDPNRSVRNQALAALAAIHADPKIVVPVLVEALRDDDQGVRQTAVQGLGRIGPQAKAAVPALIKLYSEAHRGVRRYTIARALGEIGPDAKAAIPVLTEALQSDDKDLQKSAARALKAISK